MQRLWILKDGAPAPLKVTTGATNGRYTEVLGGELAPGMLVITETAAPAR